MAAVNLRFACIDHAEAIARSCQTGQSAESASLYRSAYQELDETDHLFQADSTNKHMVTGHRVLLDISVGFQRLEECFQIDKWGRNSQNIVVSQYLGLLMLRFSRKLFMDTEDLGKALLEGVRSGQIDTLDRMRSGEKGTRIE